MDALTKIIVFLAVLGVFGAALFFFPGSPIYYDKVKTIIVRVPVPVEQADESPAAATEETESMQQNATEQPQ